MVIRGLFDRDRPMLQALAKQYALEFSPSQFDKGPFISRFIVLNDDETPVTIVGLRSIAEVIAVTDQNLDVKVRREGLIRAYDAAAYLAGASGYDQLHAFVQDETWHHQLLKHGFKNTAGRSVVIDI